MVIRCVVLGVFLFDKFDSIDQGYDSYGEQ